MNDVSTQGTKTGVGYWRAATLGTPLWLMVIVAGFFAIAPVVSRIAPDLSDIAVEFASIVTASVISLAVAAVLFTRGTAPKWRGLAIGIVTAAVLAVEFGAIHFGVNVNAEYVAAS